MDPETRNKLKMDAAAKPPQFLKMLSLRMSEDDTFEQLMKSVLQNDEKYKENVENLKKFINEGSTFKDAFLKLSEIKEGPCSNDLEEIIEAVIKTQAVMPDKEVQEKIFFLWRKELTEK